MVIAEEIKSCDKSELSDISELYKSHLWKSPTKKQINEVREDSRKVTDALNAIIVFMTDILAFIVWKRIIFVVSNLEGGIGALEKWRIISIISMVIMTIIALINTYNLLKREDVRIAEKVESGEFEVLEDFKVLNVVRKGGFCPCSFIVEVDNKKYHLTKFRGKVESTQEKASKEYLEQFGSVMKTRDTRELMNLRIKQNEMLQTIKETRCGACIETAYLVKAEIKTGLIFKHTKSKVYLYFSHLDQNSEKRS